MFVLDQPLFIRQIFPDEPLLPKYASSLTVQFMTSLHVLKKASNDPQPHTDIMDRILRPISGIKNSIKNDNIK